jgi:hypothetical protein
MEFEASTSARCLRRSVPGAALALLERRSRWPPRGEPFSKKIGLEARRDRMTRGSGIAGGLLLLVAAMAASAPAADTARLAWLEGRWVGEKDGVSMEELWTAPRGGALLGLHTDVKAGRLVSWEFLRIADAGEGLTYFGSPRSAPPTPFKLVEIGERRAVFENREHDFPQRILYWLDGQGALHARIEGPQEGKTVSEEWVFTRAR